MKLIHRRPKFKAKKIFPSFFFHLLFIYNNAFLIFWKIHVSKIFKSLYSFFGLILLYFIHLSHMYVSLRFCCNSFCLDSFTSIKCTESNLVCNGYIYFTLPCNVNESCLYVHLYNCNIKYIWKILYLIFSYSLTSFAIYNTTIIQMLTYTHTNLV